MTFHPIGKVHQNHLALMEAQKFGAMHEHSVPHLLEIMFKVSVKVGDIMSMI